MDEATINRTKAVINALLDVEQYWIDSAPEYNLTQKDIAKLQKKLKKARDNIDKIAKSVEEKAEAVD